MERLSLPGEAMMSINTMHAKPDLRVFLEWMIARSGSVITDVIPQQNQDLNGKENYS